MKEGSRAIMATLDAMLREHGRILKAESPNAFSHNLEETHAALEYHEELFRSISFRVLSVNERIHNIINLVSKI